LLSLLLLLGIGAGRDAILLAISSTSLKSMFDDAQAVQQVLDEEIVDGEGSSCCGGSWSSCWQPLNFSMVLGCRFEYQDALE